MMGKYDVLLASGSVQRKAILEELGITYKSVAMDVDEVTLASPSDTVRENARLKLQAGKRPISPSFQLLLQVLSYVRYDHHHQGAKRT